MQISNKVGFLPNISGLSGQFKNKAIQPKELKQTLDIDDDSISSVKDILKNPRVCQFVKENLTITKETNLTDLELLLLKGLAQKAYPGVTHVHLEQLSLSELKRGLEKNNT